MNTHIEKLAAARMIKAADIGAGDVAAGVAGAGGLGLLYAAHPMLRAWSRVAAKRLAASKKAPKLIRSLATKARGTDADFIADYIKSTNRFGKIPGVLRWLKSRAVKKAPTKALRDWDLKHYDKFLAARPEETFRHLAREIRGNLGRRTKGMFDANTAAVFNKGGLLPDAMSQGMNADKAIRSLGEVASVDKGISNYLKLMAKQQEVAAGAYGQMAAKPIMGLGVLSGGLSMLPDGAPEEVGEVGPDRLDILLAKADKPSFWSKAQDRLGRWGIG